MTSEMAGAVKGSFGFLNGFDPCKGSGPFGVSMKLETGSFWHPASVKRADKVCQNNQIGWALAMRMIKR